MNEQEKRYYEVECKCGHTGSRKYYIPVKFAVIACDGKEAAKKGRMIPRCKHNHKDCVLGVREITKEEYYAILETNNNDPYLKCHSIQEQSRFDLSDRFVEDPHYSELHPELMEKEKPNHPFCKGKTMVRNPKKYVRFYSDYNYSMEVC